MSDQHATASSGPSGATAAPPDAGVLEVAPEAEGTNDDDANSALGEDDNASSTASITSSILEYRAIKGRTYHSTRHPTEYFTPNDAQQQDSIDCTHHYLTVLLDDKLFLAPISETPQSVVDIGTGTGLWAIDFADQYPSAKVVGTDLSPIQPSWVPPNVKFEIDDATLAWTWADNSFDFVHMRYLFGAIIDWPGLFKEAFRCCKPGGWVQSAEVDVDWKSDDGTVDGEPLIKTWGDLYIEGGKKTGRVFTVVADDLQRKGMEEAGFTDIQVVNLKLPIGGWPLDRKLAEVGRLVQLTIENDIEGYTLMMWHNVLQWPPEDYQMFLMGMRKNLRNKAIHAYMPLRYVFGRKPETS